MTTKTLTELHEKIKTNLAEYYNRIESEINRDTAKITSDPKAELDKNQIIKCKLLANKLINLVNETLDSCLANIDKYFSQLDELNKLLPSLSDINNFFNDNVAFSANQSEELINEESIKKSALNSYVVYISGSKLHSKGIVERKIPGVFIKLGFYPNRNNLNYIRAIFEGKNSDYEFDSNVLNTKYQLDKQIVIMKDIRSASTLQLIYTHVKTTSIFEIKQLDISNIKSLKLSMRSLIECRSMVKFDENTFKYFHNLENFSFVGYKSISDFNSPPIFHLNSSINLFKSIQHLKNLCRLTLTHCPIASLENGCFNNFVNLVELNLSKNSLKIISKENFDGLTNLLSLNLSENSIKELTEFPFQSLKNLRYLDLSSNSIDDLKLDSFGYSLTNLEILDLRDNPFKEIRKNVLKHLIRLKEIRVPEYFLNYSKINLFKEIGVDKKTIIIVGKPTLTYDMEYDGVDNHEDYISF